MATSAQQRANALAPAAETVREYQTELFAAAARSRVDEMLPRRALLRLDEVCAHLGISDTHLRRLLDEGALASVLVNTAVDAERKHLRIPREAVVRFCAEREVRA